MWRNRRILLASITAALLLGRLVVSANADPAITPSLVISQLKVTSSNGQFVTLYNTTDGSLDMSKYQLEYFNSYDLAKATSSKLVALSGTVPPHGYFMINDSALLLCFQLTVDSLSLGFSSTAGLVEVLGFNQSVPGGSVSPVLQDYVGWSKTAASGAQTLPSSTNGFLLRQPVTPQNNPNVVTAGTGSWQTVQPDPANACGLVSGTSLTTPVSSGLSQLLPSTEPPATILAVSDVSAPTAMPSLPASDVGLMAPRVTEILPNPTGTGNDATDEFIELYNPNAATFDLTGFGLQSGATTLHSFTFPAGTTLPPQSFTAFYASLTGLSLSNTSGQVKLLDPFDNSLSASDVYGTAADGQTWALANGAWFWTTSPTPGAANVINQPPAKKMATKSSSSSSKTSGASTAKPKTKSSAVKSSTTAAGKFSDTPSTSPIHPWTLALVAGLAVLYGAYEYRTDLGNRIHQLRKNLRTRHRHRAKA